MDPDTLMSLLQKIGIEELRMRGGDIGGRCPSGLHEDRRPSWGISLTEPHKHGCFTCFPAGTLVDTLKGGVPIEQIRLGDSIVSSNGSTGSVVRCIRNPPESLVEVRFPVVGFSFKSTATHGIYARKLSRDACGRVKDIGPLTKVPASELTSDHWVLLAKRPDVDLDLLHLHAQSKYAGKTRSIPTVSPSVELAEFCGWYSAEGSISSKGRVVFFTLNYAETDYAKRIVELGERLFGLRGVIRPDKEFGRLDVYFCSTVLASYLTGWCGKGASKKHAPNFVRCAPGKYGRAYLGSLYAGDGHRSAGNRKTITTVSPELAHDVARLASDLGYVFSSHEAAASFKLGVRRRVSWKVSFRSTWERNATRMLRKEVDGRTYLRVKSVLHLKAKVPVYNLTVSPIHTYSVNGIEVANCGFKGVLQSLLVQVGNYNPVQAKIVCGTLSEKPDVDVSELRRAMDPHRRESMLFDADEMYPYPLTQKAIDYFEKKRGIKRATLEIAGVGYDKKESRVLFPWYRKGKIVAIVGRYIGKREDASKIKNYILGQNKRLNVYVPFRRFFQSELVIVEGEIDALKVFQAKFANVCAIGSASVVEEQFSQIANSGATSFRIFTDDDGPGRKIASELDKYLSKVAPTSVVDYSPVRKILGVGSGKLDPGMLSTEHIQLLLDQGRCIFPKMQRL